jgi:hypothetical protein
LYALDSRSQINGSVQKFASPLVKDNGVYTIPWGTKLQAAGRLGISVEVFDYLNGASNRCGVYSLELYLDDQLRYRHVMDEFSFNETRFINAHIDYEERISQGTKAHRLHRLPNNRLRIYDQLVDDGELVIEEGRTYQVRILARDVAGNESELRFGIMGSGEGELTAKPEIPDKQPMKWNETNRFDQDPVSLTIPRNALYRDMDFTFDILPAEQGSLTNFYQIGSEEVPVHTPYTLSIASEGIEPALWKKLLLVTLDEDGKITEAGGEYKDGRVSSNLRYFGKFAIGIDTIPPLIQVTGGAFREDMTGRKRLKFLITDELSGIEKYEGYLNDRWVLFEYDMKNDLLVHEFDREVITPNSTHKLELYVTDSKGNSSLYQKTFNW